MEDHEHPELDWDPLDDTKIWPETEFPLRHIGVMTLNRNVEDIFNENEQIAMGTGVLVDGLDFSDDKMLVGRTFSYSDTQRYRVGTNYLQLPVNQPKNAARRNQPARRPDVATASISRRGRTRTSTSSRRSTTGCTKPQREQPNNSPGDPRPADPQRDRAPQRLCAGARPLLHDDGLGARRPGPQHGRRCSASASATCRSACCGTSSWSMTTTAHRVGKAIGITADGCPESRAARRSRS